MRKIITTTMLTLDGVMQAPGDSEEDTSEGFVYGGWQTSWNEEADEITERILAAPSDLLLGRITYEIFARYWPYHTDEPHWGKRFDKAKKYVVAHGPFPLTWNNSELITGNVAERIRALKNTDGPDLWVWGSGQLIQTLLENNLVDRMCLWVFPVTIGSGKKLFAGGTHPQRFKQVEAKVLATGALFAAFEPTVPLEPVSA